MMAHPDESSGDPFRLTDDTATVLDVMRYHIEAGTGGNVSEEDYAELTRVVARDYGGMSPLALQIEAMQAALDRKDEQIADLMRQNASMYAALSTVEEQILEIVSDTRLGLLVEEQVNSPEPVDA